MDTCLGVRKLPNLQVFELGFVKTLINLYVGFDWVMNHLGVVFDDAFGLFWSFWLDF